MKKITIFFFFVVSFFCILSCDQMLKNATNEWQQETAIEKTEGSYSFSISKDSAINQKVAELRAVLATKVQTREDEAALNELCMHASLSLTIWKTYIEQVKNSQFEKAKLRDSILGFHISMCNIYRLIKKNDGDSIKILISQHLEGSPLRGIEYYEEMLK